MQWKPVLLVLSGIGAAGIAFTLLGPGETVTVEKKSFKKGHADVMGTDAQQLQLADHRPQFHNAAEDTGGPRKGRKAGPGGRAGNGPGQQGPGAEMVEAGGRAGGIVKEKQALMTPEEAEEMHQQAWRGMQQSISRVATKHNLTSETTNQLSSALEAYMDNQKSLWDSVASGDLSQEEAMSQSETNKNSIQSQITGLAGADTAKDLSGSLGGGAPGDAQGNMGTPPGGPQGQGGMPPGGEGGMPPGGGMGPPPGGGGMGPPPGGGAPPGGGGMGPPPGGR